MDHLKRQFDASGGITAKVCLPEMVLSPDILNYFGKREVKRVWKNLKIWE